ncbi:hypothetical protein CW708_02420 [Candidatus Bathyarchaeota archaeon]|nr:MAG: hypothetical protein CW708_02420 [Candidatus Bathyarchaeota archaeon]
MCMRTLYKIPTSCKTLDKALEGGIPVGNITLLYGEAETGKTTFSMQCAVNCAKLGYKTLFIDADSTFSVGRLSQLTSKDSNLTQQIYLMKPADFKEQASIIDQLANYITRKFGLIIFDTITSLYRVEISENPKKTFDLNRELNRQLAFLAQTAKIKKVAILITSQVRSILDETYEVEPVATRVLKFWSDVILAVKPTENPTIVKIFLEKKPSKTKLIECYLKIGKEGIKDYITA